jgi:hypothetical protein
MSDDECPAGGLHDWQVQDSAASPPVYRVCTKCGQFSGIGEGP